MPLKLKLAAHEQLVVNGAVMVNGDYRTTLLIRNFSHILREKDVLQQGQADTPTKLLYFQVQAMLLAQPPTPSALQDEYARQLARLRLAYTDPDHLDVLDEVDRLVGDGDHYKALRQLQSLIAVEAGLLNRAAPSWRRPSAAAG